MQVQVCNTVISDAKARKAIVRYYCIRKTTVQLYLFVYNHLQTAAKTFKCFIKYTDFTSYKNSLAIVNM